MNRFRTIILFFTLTGLLCLGITMQMTRPIFAQDGPEFTELKARLWRSGQLPDVSPNALSLQSDQQPILPDASVYFNPDDPDYWTTIAFQGFRDGYWHVYAMRGNADGGPWMVANVVSLQPSLTYQAGRVAYVSKYEGQYHIYKNGINGYYQRRLTQDPFPDVYPDWSPDDAFVAFSRGVDFKQWDLYRVSADGLNQKRLTHSGADDVTPDWSPDGRQIVWVQRSGDDASLWVMNADGSGQHQLTGPLKYLQNPRWSPDGGKIAFDYDADDDGLNELVTINVDGSGLQVIYDPNAPMVDIWMGAWSWKGDEILFTAVKYVLQDGELYISDSNLARLALASGEVRMYDLPGVEVHPDWQPQDRLAPESEMDALPGWGPAPITVTWRGKDRGPSGILSYDVQVKQPGDSAWTYWLRNTHLVGKRYQGVGGQTYLFRVRARDRAGNEEPWPEGYQAGTTVENLPPVSSFKPLKPYERYAPWVNWCGYDPGGSGIARVSTQVREGKDGVWQDWLTFKPSQNCFGAVWRGETGKTYYFRARAIDRAQNEEPWPEGDGDTWTTPYGWMIDGRVFDNRGRAVTGMTAVTKPAGFENRPSNAEGAYAVYGHKDVENFTVSWQREGFGSPPAMTFSAKEDVHQDILLPPADDVVENGGFESGGFAPSWTPSPSGASIISDTVYSGDYAMALACPEPRVFAPIETAPIFPISESFTPHLQTAIDDAGRVHILFSGWDGAAFGVKYTRREPDGRWLPTETIASASPGNASPKEAQFAVDAQGNVVVVWHSSTIVMYSQRPVDGSWSQPEAITPPIYLPNARIGIDSQGTVHVAWRGRGDNSAYTWQHLAKPFTGTWGDSEWITASAERNHFWLLVDGLDGVHFVWEDGGGVMWHRLRAADGTWSPAQRIYDWGTNNHPGDQYYMATDGVGGIHFLFVHTSSNPPQKMMYVHRGADGVVTEPFRADIILPSYKWGGYPDRYAQLAVEDNGTAHVTWNLQGGRGNKSAWLMHRQRTPQGQWLDPEKTPIPKAVDRFYTALTPDGALHFMGFYYYYSPSSKRLYYLQKRGADWSNMESMVIPSRSALSPAFILAGPDNRAHFVWISRKEVDYSRTAYDEQPEGIYSVSQRVTVPDADRLPFAAFLYRLSDALDPHRAALYLKVEDEKGVVEDAFMTDANTGEQWKLASLDLTPWAGKQITMTVQMHQPAGALCARTVIDEISLGQTAFPALWVRASSAWGQPGQQVHQTIAYANMGDTLASNVVISLTLPAGLTLIAADPPPDTQGDAFLWRLGDLLEGAQGAIELTLDIAADAPSPGDLESEVALTSDATELDLLDNRAMMHTQVGQTFEFLPLLQGNR